MLVQPTDWTDKFLKRLAPYEFELTRPGQADNRTLAELSRFRADVLRACGSLPEDTSGECEDADREAWHLIVRTGGAIAGCIRLFLFEAPLTSCVPQRVLTMSRCDLTAGDRAMCLTALAEYIDNVDFERGPLIQFGGLSVHPSLRRSVVGPSLCLASTAFTRVVQSPGGALFGAQKTGGPSLYSKAGCFPLTMAGVTLPAFHDRAHDDHVVLMGSGPWRSAPECEGVVLTMQAKLVELMKCEEVACA